MANPFEIEKVIAETITVDLYEQQNKSMFSGNEAWNQLQTGKGLLYEWEEDSTFLRNPPFFQNMSKEARPIESLNGLRVLVKLGDSVTTDHISPAGGTIPPNSVAGKYLLSQGVKPGI